MRMLQIFTIEFSPRASNGFFFEILAQQKLAAIVIKNWKVEGYSANKSYNMHVNGMKCFIIGF